VCPAPPTTSPVSAAPTTNPPTKSPTKSPVTAAPTTKSPVTAAAAPTRFGSSGSKWYADWTSSEDQTCKNDGNAPEYMVKNGAAWLFEDQQACCTSFFSFNLKECLGIALLGSRKYYPDWTGDNKGIKAVSKIQVRLLPPSTWLSLALGFPKRLMRAVRGTTNGILWPARVKPSLEPTSGMFAIRLQNAYRIVVMDQIAEDLQRNGI
jgi:hypothetical protein